MKLSTSAVLLALALTSAIMTVTAAAGSRKMLAANAADATTKVEKKDSTKQWGWGGFGFGGWGGDSGHPAYPHYDYHAPEYVQHGDHYHYVPGHLDYDAFGKRKLLSTVTVEPVEAAEPARSIESTLSTAAAKPSKPAKKAKSVKKTESAQKTDAADHNGHGWGHRHNQGHPSRPHYDYHAASFVPHGDHYHYVPSHYDFHAHGRKMLSPDTNESAEETAAVKATNSQESAQKTAAADQWGTDHGYQFTDNPYQYSQNPFGHHTPGTIPAFGGFPGNSAFGHSHNWGRKMLTAESADAIESTDSTQKTDKTDKADKTNNNEQYGTDHEYQFTDDPYQYTSRYVDHPAEYVQHGDHAHYVPEHQDWYDANAAQHTPGTIPLSSFGRKLMAAESAANAESSKKSEKTQAKDQWGNYYAYHQGEYVPHGDHVHYVPDHYDAVQGTQVAPGVIIPGAAGSVLPAWGKRKLLAAESTTAAESTQSADAVKVAEGAASTKKVEKADQYGTNHGYVFTDPAYQNTPHYDYHAPEYVQHGDHYHYVPGHYDQHDPRYNGDHDDDHHDHDHDQYSNNNYGSSVGSMVAGIIGGILGGR